MADAPLRAGLAACGGIAPLTLEAARRSPDFDVVAIQDPDEAALERTGDRYGIRRRHRGFEDLLAEDVDFVVVSGPNDVHLPQVALAAAAGKHCLVQKPMAPTLAAAEEMVRVAARHGIRLGVLMFELGKPRHHQLREMVSSGWLGFPTLVQSVCAHTIYLREPPPPGDWRRDPERVGGGALIQLGLHHLNLASWILGRDVVSVAAGGTRGRTVFPEETTLATALFAGGTIGHFAASYAADLTGFSVLGTRGRVHLLADHVVVQGEEPFRGEVFAYAEAGREVALPAGSMREAVERRRDALEVHGAFARWLLGRGDYPATGERALRDLGVVMAAYRAREEGTWVDVS